MFSLSCACSDDMTSSIHALPRSVAQEITILAAFAPIIFSNVAVEYLDRVWATDASNHKGAIVAASIHPEVQEALWLGTYKKGAYTHLDNGFHATLRSIGEVDEDLEQPSPFQDVPAISKQPLLYFDFVELCGGAGKVSAAMSNLGFSVAPILDLSESEHYDLTGLRFTEWCIYMLEEGRFRSFLIAPPCTTFSPAAHPAVRSYKEPLGFSRTDPKTLRGNLLAFRALCLLTVARQCERPCAGEQSRLSKMCWLELWKALLEKGFSEAVIASCVFGSIHRKEFRLICYLLDTDFFDERCRGGHSHVRVEGKYTKASATYVDGLAWHIALAFKQALDSQDAQERLSPDVTGFETPLSNDVMLSSKWDTERAWFWKKPTHINVLELAAAVSNLASVAKYESHARFL